MISFSDPCHCEDAQNCLVNNVLYFHDVMRIPAAGMLASGLDIRVASNSHFYISVPCNGGVLNAPIFGTPIPETSPGVYELNYWRPSGVLPTFSVIEGGIITTAPPNTFAPICNQADCNPDLIPTMSQWGLLIFWLLIMNLCIILLYQKERILCK